MSASGSAPFAPPRLALSLQKMAETTGGEFGISVPMLLVRLRNVGLGPARVPKLGLDMLLSLQITLRSTGRTERRAVSLRLPWTVSLQELASGAELLQGISPLSRGQRDVPLPLGRHLVEVCVLESAQAAYPSAFAQTFGGTCSNPIEVVVERRPDR